jgi:BTB And C-terminal Kelch
MGSPLSCNPSQFQAIFQNLSLYPSSDHERIEIVHQKSGYYPITKAKELFFNSQDLKTAEFALIFFEANLASLSKVTKPSSFFSKFVLIFQSEPLIQRFSQLCEELFHRDMVRSTAQVREKMIQETQKECDAIRKEITFLQETKIEMQNTLFVCQEGQKIHAHFKILQEISFFKNYGHSGMEKVITSFITEEEKRKYPHIFDFTDFSSKTLHLFLTWLKDPESISKVNAFEDLFEIYRLADFVDNYEFQSSCAKRFSEELDDEKIFKILSYADYSTGDLLIKHCCKYVVDQFKLLAETAAFLKIKHEYLIEILKSDTIYLEEIKIFNAVLKWAHAHQENRTVQDVLYKVVEGTTLIECTRFQYIPKDEFILNKDLFSTHDKEKWYEFHLRNKIISHLRCAPAGFFSQFSGKQVKIRWAVPMDDYEIMKKKCADDVEGVNFPCKNHSGEIKLFKSKKFKNNMGIEVTLPLQVDFDFFVQINGLRYYYYSPAEGTKFHRDQHGGLSHKSCYFTFDELEKNVDMNQDFVLIKLLIFLK